MDKTQNVIHKHGMLYDLAKLASEYRHLRHENLESHGLFYSFWLPFVLLILCRNLRLTLRVRCSFDAREIEIKFPRWQLWQQELEVTVW
jgi:hypothetical protein